MDWIFVVKKPFVDCIHDWSGMISIVKGPLWRDEKTCSFSIVVGEKSETVIVGAEAGVISAIEILTAGADYLGKTVAVVWQKVSQSNSDIPTVCIMGGPTRNQTYVNLIKSAINSHLECNFTNAKSDHLVGAPLTAEMYPAGVDPLFKWWHA